MKKLMWCLTVLAIVGLLTSSILEAQEVVTQEDAEQQALQQQIQILKTNIAALRAKQARAAILKQLLDEELADLRQMQAVFCDQYNLDINKFRAGLYRFNEEKAMFEELEPATTPEVPVEEPEAEEPAVTEPATE